MKNNIKAWLQENIPTLDNKTYLVTGTNSGLGFHIAESLAFRGATVYLGGKREDAVDKAILSIKSEIENAKLHKVIFNLADLEDVQRTAQRLLEQNIILDGLINNAGVLGVPYTKSKQGHELHFAVNHLGHFLLSQKLIPLLEKSAGRVVNMSSYGYLNAKGDLNPDPKREEYMRMQRYFESKLYNVLFALKFNKQSEQTHSEVKAYLAHPGLSATTLFPTMKTVPMAGTIGKFFLNILGQNAAMGALGAVYAATSPTAKINKLYGPKNGKGEPSQKGYPEEIEIDRRLATEDRVEELWQTSLKLTQQYAD